MSISRISTSDVHRICSGQVITSLSTAIKELVENSLDAGATSVDVTLRGSGADVIEVSDNGSGVEASNYETLVLKHYTSKLRSFSDLTDGVQSFGFRGEALSSLCELSESFTVITRQKGEPIGTELNYARSGKLLSKKPAARPVGTTVRACGIFSPLPVRRREFMRTLNKQYARLISTVQAYAVMQDGVRMCCTNTKAIKGKRTKKGKRNVGAEGGFGAGGGESSGKVERVLSTQGTRGRGGNISSLFGSKFFRSLQSIDIDVSAAFGQSGGDDSSSDKGKDKHAGSSAIGVTNKKRDRDTPRITGFVSKSGAGVGRSNTDRQFLFIRGRPVDLPKAVKAANEVWRQFEMKVG